MTSSTADLSAGTQKGFGKLLGQALLGGAAAALANVLVYFIGQALGVAYTGEFQPGAVGGLPLPAVVIFSVVPGVFAAGAAFLLQKYTAQGARNFAILAVVFCVLSFGGPANVKQASVATIVAMELMHAIAALGIGGALYRALRR